MLHPLSSALLTIMSKLSLPNLVFSVLAARALSLSDNKRLVHITNLYSSVETSNSWTNMLGKDQWIVISDNEENCHVFFRGSDEPADYLFDGGNLDYFLKYVYTTADNRYLGIAHYGFTDAFNALEGFLDQSILNGCGSLDRRITFAGWSRGGALSVLAAVRHYVLYGRLKTELITWGCPRVLERDYATLYNKRFSQVRFMNQGDGITSLPPANTIIYALPFSDYAIGEYQHFGDVVCLDCSLIQRDSQQSGDTQQSHVWSQYRRKINLLPTTEIDENDHQTTRDVVSETVSGSTSLLPHLPAYICTIFAFAATY